MSILALFLWHMDYKRVLKNKYILLNSYRKQIKQSRQR